jgi:hypothetical protein
MATQTMLLKNICDVLVKRRLLLGQNIQFNDLELRNQQSESQTFYAAEEIGHELIPREAELSGAKGVIRWHDSELDLDSNENVFEPPATRSAVNPDLILCNSGSTAVKFTAVLSIARYDFFVSPMPATTSATGSTQLIAWLISVAPTGMESRT